MTIFHPGELRGFWQFKVIGGFSYLVMQWILFIFTIYSSNVQFVSIQINLILLFIFLIKVLC